MFEIEALSFGCFLRHQLALQDNNLEPVGRQYRSGGRLLQGFFHIVEQGGNCTANPAIIPARVSPIPPVAW